MTAGPDIARLSLPGISVAHCLLPAWEVGDYISRSAASSVGASFTSQHCDIELGGRCLPRTVRGGSIALTGPEAPSWLRVDRPSDFIEIRADSTLRAAVADEYRVSDSADLADLATDLDPISWALAYRLRFLARSPKPPSSLEVETLVRLFYAQALQRNFGGRLRAKGNGGLDPRRAARVVEFIDANLDGMLNLDALADIAALSSFHFHRSFRRSFGCTPHQYVALKKRQRSAILFSDRER